MSNNINWMDNKVVNPNTIRQTPRQPTRPAARPAYTAPSDPEVSAAPSVPQMQQNGTAESDSAMFPPGFPPATEKGYIPYYLASNIGKNVRAEFIIGGSQYSDKVGRLIEVGINYFVLEDVNSRTHVMCDMYSVKFVTVLLMDGCFLA